MENTKEKQYRLLLHVCCAPCSIEPIRLLLEEGYDLTLFYSNSNIAPEEEYHRRLDTLISWAQTCNIPLVEDSYQPSEWIKAQIGVRNDAGHHDRCRNCYRLRFAHSAQYAAEHGFDGICTTLSVSPYQYFDIIREELEQAARTHGIDALAINFSPYFDEGTKKSREINMYRQNYCGCLPSKAEAEKERNERKEQRRKEKQLKALREAPQRERKEQQRQKCRAEKQQYAQKQAKKRALLKAFKEQQKEESVYENK